MLNHIPSSAVPVQSAAQTAATRGDRSRRLVAVFLALSLILMMSYSAVSIYMATRIQATQQTPPYATPASLGLSYKDVTFPSRDDHLQIRGWFIPGVLSNRQLTSQRTIIMVHGNLTNRADKGLGLLDLSGDLARRGFAILAFDMRGAGDSPAAPRSFGIYEQRDALGAVDFLQSGPLPYPELGRPRAIVGWGASLGGAIIIMAAAKEPAIRAIVSDSAYAAILPRLERGIPAEGYPALLTPGGLIAAQVLYGVDYYHARPVDVIASIAPRPILLIHGAEDNKDHATTPPADMYTLAAAALNAPQANVQTWMVPGATHVQAYHVEGKAYIDRLDAFYTAALGPDTSRL